MINYIKYSIYLFVLIGFNISHAGSYEDFFKAIKTDDAGTIQSLLARGFDPNTLDPQVQHGLILAIREPSPKVIKALLAAPNLDLNALNAKGESPLMLAVFNGDLDLASQMIKKGADVNKTGWTPLHYAATKGHVPLIRLLIENHAYIDAESPNGSTPLMMASMYGSAEAVRLLLDEGADPLLRNQQGLTATQFAQRVNRQDVADMIARSVRSKRPAGQW
ncbi:MAG: ankyrin repeat domain-containing protein [Polaromonas sp.]|uniref:ankyrin repeat domain-containing protein n=1 Tax=Polaromonas sp. TaxID=1869339 RepID=UPI0025F90DF2|nr:ankyrin repeat domain-containing protein [Polaromonas sp.]MBI2725152.1 ankyrin repeat domain-containing protein [Polaromonas sp.]